MASKDLIRMTEGTLDNIITEAVNYEKIGGKHFSPRCSSSMMVDIFNDYDRKNGRYVLVQANRQNKKVNSSKYET